MNSWRLAFDFPPALQAAVPLAALVFALMIWRGARAGVPRLRALCLAALRTFVVLLLAVLLARPVLVAKEPASANSRQVVVLMDRSESMSLRDQSHSRYEEALNLLRDRLLPALRAANLPTRALVFAHSAEEVTGTGLVSASPNGKRTNLGGAIAQACANEAAPPLAIVALTDGISNEPEDNGRGLAALAEAGVPFIGLGFGSDQGVKTLTLRDVQAPTSAATKAAFNVSAELEAVNAEEMPAFDLLLFRDGQLFQKKKVSPRNGSRIWLENFSVTEAKEAMHDYTVQVMPPDVENLKCANLLGTVPVRISDEKEIRVLYIQGSLTWDYKFIGLALRGDPTIKITGVTRTTKESVFRQNIEAAGELASGFPSSMEELAPFRVVVLSNLRAAELTGAQQELLARFCGEFGGGLIMLGGPATFDESWKKSRLEQLLPVVFAADRGVQGLDRPFHLQLTPEALSNPIFQIAESGHTAESWSRLPTFTQFGRVDAAKPGAQVWARHESEEGPQGRRILMASQRYGAGLSAVLCIQNFWRWRLAKDGDPAQFDRFWRQLFRYLSEIGRPDVAIRLADQDLHPDMDVRVILEKQPDPKNASASPLRKFLVRVENPQHELLHEEGVELEPLHPTETRFHAAAAGVYTISVCDAAKVPISTRPIEVRDVSVEFQNTGRDMESLRQWAAVSDGLALKEEECDNAGSLVERIRNKIEQVRKTHEFRRPAGINGWTLLLALGCLSAEWVLKKRWSLV